MTATAFAFEPALDLFDDGDGPTHGQPRRPQLRIIQGGGLGQPAPAPLAVLEPTAEIYRRRRFLALLTVAVMVIGLAWMSGVSVATFGEGQAASSQTDVVPAVHVVLPGESYAAIAAELGAANPVAAGQQMKFENGGSELVVGQRLVVNAAVLLAG